MYMSIWLWVKIVYGTFRGVPDVWNEGASQHIVNPGLINHGVLIKEVGHPQIVII